MSTDIYLIAFALALALAGLKRWRSNGLPLPPGPRGYPIIGNLLDMPSEHQWVKYHEWSKKYNSDVIYLNVLGSPIVVLNSYKAANDLLGVRSTLYSDRPMSTMLNELLGWKTLTSFLPYGHAWRARRRAFWQEFNPEHSTNHRPKQLWYSRDLLRRLLEDPKRFLHHINYTLSATIIAISYGVDVQREDDPNVERANKALVNLKEAAISGSFMVDMLPFLKYIPTWMPGAGFKAYAERMRPLTMDMREAPYEQGCSRLREGKGEPSILSRGLGGHSIDSHPDAELIKDVTWVAYSGGAETSPLAISTFLAAMLLYPDVQKKGQKELDTYIGARLPVFEDLPHLPYIRAIMLEVLRWQSVLPLGAPHRLTMDDEYKGYSIPKGSTIFVNVWALLRDEEVYPDPDIFNPERFLKDGEIDPKTLDPIPNFGFGRRICPGRFFAMDSISISIASILSCFDIAKARDARGRDIEQDIQWEGGFTRHIIPFECAITPRSAEAAKLISDSELM
ncbi:cytochrome P450 [Pleurotus eryngii]|uniref:Cytochrome P450 n=1 Tax=Pleurotus eryngii TaxID=5323 RepID=A0A9P5ZYN1_PLEER|nr:cytochrome P450 [Pleurotus eryngii]